MIYVVTNVFVGGSCPKFLQPVGTEMRKTNHHAFESEEHLSRYLTGLEQWVKELGASRNNYLGFSALDEDGNDVYTAPDDELEDALFEHFVKQREQDDDNQ